MIPYSLGSLPSGQLRLMFSSAQIEYIRYWIHAMKLSTSLLPIPSSEYLLTHSVLRDCSEVYYKSPAELRKGFKVRISGEYLGFKAKANEYDARMYKRTTIGLPVRTPH